MGPGSGTVEAHWDTLSGGRYVRAGDTTSDFSPGDAANGVFQLLATSTTTPELGFVKSWPPHPQPPPPQPANSSTQVLPTPPATSHHGRRRPLSVEFIIRWSWHRARTRLDTLRAVGFPRHARIVVRCAGHGCPKPAGGSGRHGLRHVERRLDGRTFRRGDRVTLSVSERGRKTERIEVRIRYGRVPLARLA